MQRTHHLVNSLSAHGSLLHKRERVSAAHSPAPRGETATLSFSRPGAPRGENGARRSLFFLCPCLPSP